MYIGDIYSTDEPTIKLASCEKHITFLLIKQSNEQFRYRMKERGRMMVEALNRPPLINITY